jgi:hypothetical protein
MEKVEVSVKESEGVLTILTGHAPVRKEVQGYYFEGEIKSPFEFWGKTVFVNPDVRQNCLVEIVEGGENLSIKLRVGYNSTLSTEVAGSLVAFPALENFGINKRKIFGPKALADLVKVNRSYFESHEAAAALVSQLRSLSVQSNSKIEQSSDDRGNKRVLADKQVIGNIPEVFVMNMPVFKASMAVKFAVEVCFDVRENIIEVWLESAELREYVAREIQYYTDKAKNTFSTDGIPVLIK